MKESLLSFYNALAGDYDGGRGDYDEEPHWLFFHAHPFDTLDWWYVLGFVFLNPGLPKRPVSQPRLAL